MAKQAKGQVTISGRFSPGTKVSLVARGSADVYAGQGDVVASAKTDRNGETSFTAAPGAYFAVATEKTWNHVIGEHEDRTRAVDVTIGDPERAPEPHHVAGPEIGPEAPAPTSLGTVGGRIIEGARGTHDLDPGTPTRIVDPVTGAVETFASPVTGVATPRKEQPKLGVPQPRQEDHRDEPLASSTLTGEAVPPMEQPISQADVPDSTPQASDTEQGFAAPARESVRQEDASGPQASDTQTGEAHPVGDPSQPRTSPTKDVPDTFKGRKGSSQPKQQTRKAKGRATSAKKADKVAKKANSSKQAKAARKAAGTAVTRSRADSSARATPATDARGVEQREVPEVVKAPTAARKGRKSR